MSGTELTDKALYEGYIDPEMPLEEIAKMGISDLTKIIKDRRREVVSKQMRNVPMPNDEVTRAVHNYARRTYLPSTTTVLD